VIDKLPQDLLERLIELAEAERPSRRGKTVRIRPKPSKCPKCRKAFKETAYGFVCPKCKGKPAKYYLDFYLNGHRYRIFCNNRGDAFSDYHSTKKYAALIQYEIDRGTFDPSKWVRSRLEEFLFKNLAEQYLSERKKVMSPAGFQAKESWFRNRLIPALGTHDVRDIRGYHLHELMEKLLDSGLSKSSVKKCFVELRAFFNWLRKLDRIEKLPTFPDHDVKPEEPPIRWLSPEQQALILSHVPPEHRNIIEFGFLTGLRIGELRALMWDAVDLREGYAIIHRSFSLDRLVETPKEKAPKVIPLVGRIREIIEEQARSKRSMFVFSYRDRNRWIAYPYKRLLAIWKQACEKAGINISLYAAIRHSFAMQRLKGGYSYEEVGAALGHKSPQTTRRYARLRAEMVESIFSSPTKVVSLTDYRRKKNSE